MKQRLISAFIGIIVLVLVLLGNGYVFDIAVTLISAVAIYEVLSALKLKEFRFMFGVALLSPVALTAVSYLPENGKTFFTPVLIAFTAVFMLAMLFSHGKCKFYQAALFIAVTFLVSMCFLHVVLTRRLGFENLDVLVILIGCWLTDTCAYFSGLCFGKHKLAPAISPKKTIEGSIGGVIGETAILAAYAYVAANIMNLSVNPISAISIGILCGLLSQCGDLCASIIKRENNIKDFGKIMPGHGGVMDRFDSLLFVAPAVYYVLLYFPIFIK